MHAQYVLLDGGLLEICGPDGPRGEWVDHFIGIGSGCWGWRVMPPEASQNGGHARSVELTSARPGVR